MSLWKTLRGERYIRPLNHKVYRVIESQYYIATRKLVDSAHEQKLLESIIDESKPLAPTSNTRGNLHYLLYTPFRYPPLPWGSRFGSRIEQSIFYASLELETAMAEAAFRQLLHLNATEADLRPTEISFSHIVAHLQTDAGVSLNEPPFYDHALAISNPISYEISQGFGKGMREAGVEVFTFFSARKKGGLNTGVFSVEAFACNKPLEQKEWKVFASKDAVEFRRSGISEKTWVFSKEEFLWDNELPFLKAA